MIQSKKAQQSETTIQKLLTVARQEFSQKGFAQASLEGIALQAGVTRGALYHHFADKRALFLAVFKQVQLEIGQEIAAAAEAGPDPWQQVVDGCHAFLRASANVERQQIVVIDAPTVLAWQDYRAIDSSLPGSGLNLLKEGLTELAQAGLIKPLPLDALAHLLSGAMDEAAVWIAQSPQPQQALIEAQLTLDVLLESLRV